MNKEFPPPVNEEPNEDTEAFRIERPGGYTEENIERHKEGYEDSWGSRGRGWKLLAGGAIVITLAGAEYFRRKYGDEE